MNKSSVAIMCRDKYHTNYEPKLFDCWVIGQIAIHKQLNDNCKETNQRRYVLTHILTGGGLLPNEGFFRTKQDAFNAATRLMLLPIRWNSSIEQEIYEDVKEIKLQTLKHIYYDHGIAWK